MKKKVGLGVTQNHTGFKDGHHKRMRSLMSERSYISSDNPDQTRQIFCQCERPNPYVDEDKVERCMKCGRRAK